MQEPVTVLFIGGEESAGTPLARALADAGFRVLASTLASGAAAAARHRQPDLIVIVPDVPDMAPAALAQLLKSDPVTAAIPLLLVRRVPDDTVEPADAYFDEPVPPESLVASARALLSLRRLENLNTTHVLLDAAGEPTLREVAEGCLEILGTSSAIYERSGACALGIFSSDWCRFLDQASREHCDASGKWLCQESCESASRRAMESRAEVDVECSGGIRSCALPILADGEVVGSIKVGYGEPPRDAARLREIAGRYGVGLEELRGLALDDRPRAPSLVNAAKRHLRTSARLLGSLVERRRAEQKVNRLNRDLHSRIHDFEALYEVSPIGIAVAEDPNVRGSLGAFVDLSAHRSAREALFRASQRLKLHVENSPLAVIEWDRDLRLTRWTGAAPGIFGWTEAEALGQRCDELLRPHQDDAPSVDRVIQDMLSGARSRVLHSNRNHRKDGTVIHCEWYNSALFDSAGELVSVLSLALDVTERNRAEEALRENEAKLRAVLDALPVGVSFMDAEARIIHSNPATRRIWGGARHESGDHCEEYRGRWLDTGLPVERSEWASSRALQGEAVLGQLIEIECLDGTRKIINNSAVPLFDTAGRLTGAAVLNEDMTEHVRAREKLKESEARLEHAQRMALLGHWEFSAGGSVAEWSDEVYRIFGLNRREFEPSIEGFLSRVHSKDRERCQDTIRAATLQGKPFELDHRILCPDGSERIVHQHGEPIFDEQGRVVRVIGTVQDVTENRRLEEQLREAQKLESVGRLAGGVAHDFNNLLTVITGYAEFVAGMLEEFHPARAAVLEIQKAGERASGLTRQLLAFSRRQVVQPRTVDLNAVIEDARKMFERLVGEDIEIATVLAGDLGPVLTDPGLLQQVLLNLVVNARDAMPAGGRLAIETCNLELNEEEARQYHGMKPGPHVLLSLSDTGTGMDAATKARIFEPFFTTKPQGEGTGLGLSTCYGIITQAGGWIGASSELGRGTTFRICLPRTRRARGGRGYGEKRLGSQWRQRNHSAGGGSGRSPPICLRHAPELRIYSDRGRQRQ